MADCHVQKHLAIQYDRKTPSSLLQLLIMGISISKFYEIVEPMRDLNALQKFQLVSGH